MHLTQQLLCATISGIVVCFLVWTLRATSAPGTFEGHGWDEGWGGLVQMPDMHACLDTAQPARNSFNLTRP